MNTSYIYEIEGQYFTSYYRSVKYIESITDKEYKLDMKYKPEQSRKGIMCYRFKTENDRVGFINRTYKITRHNINKGDK